MKFKIQIATPKVTLNHGTAPRYTAPGGFSVGHNNTAQSDMMERQLSAERKMKVYN